MIETEAGFSRNQKLAVLAAGFAAWMFAGLENALFVLIHRQMMLSLLPAGSAEAVITEWFAWNQAAFMLGAAVGGWLFGLMGDRIGRVRTLGWSVVLYSLADVPPVAEPEETGRTFAENARLKAAYYDQHARAAGTIPAAMMREVASAAASTAVKSASSVTTRSGSGVSRTVTSATTPKHPSLPTKAPSRS